MAVMFTTMLATMKAAGAAATSAVGAAGSAAASGGALSALSVASTVAGGLASIYSGAQEGAALDQQAVDEETRAVQEEIEGKQDALNALRQLNRDQARIAVSGYASGIGGEGSIQAAQDEADKIGNQNIDLSRENARFRSASRRAQARQFRTSADGARSGGVFGAIKGGLSLASRRNTRG